ncbi:hypothetical protein HNR09_000757 [Nesterenkonia xinjiangensis]|uniref:Uncharacterized protein n=1 Tax=Nesterenkonia xinjiangensis TaxID=225327 RepID=A0A7Z0K871_9MICC|nr:hypothetical protein [Nesterenkonia xinjiangensis]
MGHPHGAESDAGRRGVGQKLVAELLVPLTLSAQGTQR